MDSSSSQANKTNAESNRHESKEEEKPTPANQQQVSSQPQPPQSQTNPPRSLDEWMFRYYFSGANLPTLESYFGSLSIADSSARQQNPFLENRWINGSSSSSINGGAGDGPWNSNNGVFLNGNSQDVPYYSRGRYGDSHNGYGVSHNGHGSVRNNNNSWRRRSNQGFLNNHDQSHSFGNPRMRSIASLAKDQSSSAELRRNIAEGSKETIDFIFEGVISHICELMVDPYGQHVIRKLMERCSSEQITQIVHVITQQQFQFVKICTDSVGALSVRSLLRFLRSEEQIVHMVGAISLEALAFTSNGNALVMILQCFKQFRPSHTEDLLEVIAQNCLRIATDEYGCRMLQQCLDTGCNVVKQRLVQEIVTNALRLCVNSYGNYVVQYLLELGDPNVTVALIEQLHGSFVQLARNKFASHVVQKFLNIGYINPSLIVFDLLRDIDLLLCDPFGNYVIQTAWFVCTNELRMILMRHIDRNKPLMRCNMYGNKILQRLNL